MSPELIIAAVSVGAGSLLVIGGWLVGRATAQKQERQRVDELISELDEVTRQLTEAGSTADGVRAQLESVRLEAEARLAAALGNEATKSEETRLSLEEARGKISELEKQLKLARATADEADKEFCIVRERLDQSEKRLAAATRELQQSGAERTLQAEAARDKALARVRELEAVGSMADDQATPNLRKELEAREVRLQELTALHQKEADEAARLRKELHDATERNAVAERVMEGVRARSSMLSQELKKARAELAQLKGA